METFYALFVSDPWLVFGCLCAALGLAVAVAIRARVKVTQRIETAEREPDPRRRVVLDASARFPPRASDRRAS